MIKFGVQHKKFDEIIPFLQTLTYNTSNIEIFITYIHINYNQLHINYALTAAYPPMNNTNNSRNIM